MKSLHLLPFSPFSAPQASLSNQKGIPIRPRSRVKDGFKNAKNEDEGLHMTSTRNPLYAAIPLVLLAVAMSCGGTDSTGNNQNQKQVLPIAPVAQELPDWCWLASGQMVFQFYQVPAVNPNYQCGIIGTFFGPSSECFYDCSACDVGGGDSSNIPLMLADYSYYATDGEEELYSQYTPSQLPFQQVTGDITAGSPVMAGINPSGTVVFGQSEHLVVIVGYEIQSGQDYLVVNDPFPFAAAGYPDPYLNAGAQALQPGQYLVSYQTFVQSLLWNNSFDGLALGEPQPLDRQKLERHFGSKLKWKRDLDLP
jgi:hypothetical protein